MMMMMRCTYRSLNRWKQLISKGTSSSSSSLRNERTLWNGRSRREGCKRSQRRYIGHDHSDSHHRKLKQEEMEGQKPRRKPGEFEIFTYDEDKVFVLGHYPGGFKVRMKGFSGGIEKRIRNVLYRINHCMYSHVVYVRHTG